VARKVNTSKEKRRSKRKDRVDYTARTMARLRELESHSVTATIGQCHDYVAMNLHEIVLDPSPEDCDRIFRESEVHF
jgi:hypothetical protein